MFKQIQDSKTNIQTAGFRYPNGTVFNGFLTTTFPTSYNMPFGIKWFIEGSNEELTDVNLPTYVNPFYTKKDGELIYTFEPVVIENDPFNTILFNCSLMVQSYLQSKYVNLYNVSIINIP